MVRHLQFSPPDGRKLLPLALIGAAVGLFAPAPAAEAGPLELVRVSGDGRANGVSFRGVSQPDLGRQVPHAANPLITGDNLYAPDFVRTDQGWHTFFGGWRTSGQANDEIYVGSAAAASPGTLAGFSTAIAAGEYLHVNDPSVVFEPDEGRWHMLYTAAKFVGPQTAANFRDWIAYSTSTDGVNWSPSAGVSSAEVTLLDPNNIAGAALSDIARPSLVKADDGWKLWFDGKSDAVAGGIHSFLAESVGDSPTQFEVVKRYEDVNNFPGFFEPDVQRRADGTYLAVIQRHFSQLHLATSDDGVNFQVEPASLDAAYPFFGRESIDNPGLIYDDLEDVLLGLGFGMTDSPNLVGHDVGMSFAQLRIELRSPDETWHVFSVAEGVDEQFVHTFHYTDFDLVRVLDAATGERLLEQEFTGASPGDVWELRVVPEPSAGLLLGGTLLLLIRRR